MAVTMEMIKSLRDSTGVSITECKKALEASAGDIDVAIEELRKKGMSKASKRADNNTSEGRIKIDTDGTTAYIIGLTCETDFVSRNDSFVAHLDEALAILKASSDAETAKATIEAKVTDWILQLGENMRLSVCEVVTGDVVGTYVHSNFKVASVISAKAGTSEDNLKQVAMHAAATESVALYPADFPTDLVEKEKAVQLEMMKNDPEMGKKPEQVLENIIAGKMKKFAGEQTLTEQAFIVNPEQTVGQFIGADALVAYKKFAI